MKELVRSRNQAALLMSVNYVILQLLKRNPVKRLGAGERDANEVKGEKFFEVNQSSLFRYSDLLSINA